MSRIPFRVGEIVYQAGLFTDRATEVKRIRRAIRDRERLLVYGERRQGKSSAIRRAVEREAGPTTTIIWIELWTVRSMSELLRRLTSAVPVGWSYLQRFQLFLARGGLRPQLTVAGPTGEPALTLGFQDRELPDETARAMFETALSGLDEIARKEGHTIVLVLDEFQEIDRITDGGAAFLRGIMQATPHVGYILAGSILSLIDRQIGPRGPLHNIDRLDIGPIDESYMARWIRSRLEAAGVESEPAVSKTIVSMAGPITEHRIQLARECFVQTPEGGVLRMEDVARAFAAVVAARSGGYELLWADLARSHQGVVRAVAAGATELQGAETRRTFDLPSASGVSKAIDVLRTRAVLSSREPIRLADPFFAEWVRRHAMPEVR